MTEETIILLCFAKAAWKKLTFNEIKSLSGKKSKSYLELVLKKFLKDKILLMEKVGRTNLYQLNVDSFRVIVFAGFVVEFDAWKKKQVNLNCVEKIMKKVPTHDFVFIVTGSYAKNKQTAGSDMDVVILVDDNVDTKRIYASLAHTCEMNIPLIHLYVFRNKEFLEMLLNNEANYGKEVIMNNLVFYGGQVYIRLVCEAMKHGFTGKFVY